MSGLPRHETRPGAHLKALPQGSINSVQLSLDQGFLNRHHGPLNVIIQANDEFQVADLSPEGVGPLIHLLSTAITVCSGLKGRLRLSVTVSERSAPTLIW